MGVATGLFFTIGQIGGVSGPAVFGYLADRTGGFATPLYLLAGICIVLALLSSYFLCIKEDEHQKQVKEDPDSELARYSTDIET